jgi:hypothetical protein
MRGVYWPAQIVLAETLEAFVEAFGTIGYEICADGVLEPSIQKVALYVGPAGVPTHAARQLDDGWWTSKLGTSIDIQHQTPEDLAGPFYGDIALFLKRPKPREELPPTSVRF